jgi:ATP/maltotriose-dependent transcriptional regulator MalT
MVTMANSKKSRALKFKPREGSKIEAGHCVKNLDGTVLSQNSVCENTCGKMVGQSCKDGCMESVKDGADTANVGMHFAHKLKMHDKVFDVVVVNDGQQLTTHFVSLEEQLKNFRDQLAQVELTEREREIASMILEGLSNSVIMQKLFISKSTLRSHLKSIYKKVGPEILEALKRAA